LATAIQATDPGLCWRLRHDLEQVLLGVALFGPRGAADDAALRALPPTTTAAIPQDLRDLVAGEFGYAVLRDPSSASA
jgi:hypothetical protein